MKTSKMILGVFILLTLATINNYAQEITLKTTEKNLVASKATIDMPGLPGNPQAIIVATPIDDTAKLNPHPIGAWYYGGKWNIFNTDHSTMPAGLQFKVQVFLKPDANHFLHIVTKENLIGDASYIDDPALNNNPNAQITIFQNHAPDNRSAYLNKYEAKAAYDPNAGQWYIKNVNGERMFPDTAFNVVVSSGGNSILKTGETSIAGIPKPAVMIPELVVRSVISDPQATTPGITSLTVVARIQLDIPVANFVNTPMSLCRSYPYPNPSVIVTDHAIVTGQFLTVRQDLRWHATVSNGVVQIQVCIDNPWQQVVGGGLGLFEQIPSGKQGSVIIQTLKVNILVIR